MIQQRHVLVPTLGALLAGASLSAADAAGSLADLTGRHTRVVWVQDAGPTACVYVEKPTVRLMGFDSADGAGERAVVAAPGSFMKPLLTADGQRIVYGDLVAHTACVVPFAGGVPTVVVRDAEFQDVWTDPADGVEWIYAKVAEKRGDGVAQVLRRYRVDQPATSELVWDQTPIFHVQVSGDGYAAAGGAKEGGNSPQGVFHLPNDGFNSPAGGCWPSMSPDDSGRLWVFQGNHRAVHMFYPVDETSGRLGIYSCDISNAPGIPKNVEVYHPRWSNDIRYLAMTGPYARFDWAGEAKITNEIAAGVEVYVGRFSADFKQVEQWVQVTHNQRGDYWPDAWVEPPAGKAVVVKKADKAKAPAAPAEDRRGLEFAYGDATTPNQVPDAKSKGIRLCEVALSGRARFGRRGVLELTGGMGLASQSAEVLAACARSGRFTVEGTFTPAAAQAHDPAVLVAFTGAAANAAPAMALVQSAGQLVLRLVTGAAPEGREIPLCAVVPGRAQHVVISYAPGQLQCAIDGRRLLLTADVQGEVTGWTATRILLGDDAGGAQGWAGTAADLAVYSRAVGPEEARAHSATVQARLAQRVPAAQVVVEALLSARSPAPDPQAIAPYRRSLSLSAFDVEKVVGGTLGAKRIVVAQWSVMDGKILPDYQELKPGTRVRLALESFDDHPEQESERQTNTLTGVDDLPLFYDVTPAAIAPAAARDVAWTASGAAATWRPAAAATWSVPGAPAAGDRVTLGDVASGTRTITSTRPETIAQLAIRQTTAGATNALVVAAPLRISGSPTPLAVSGAGAVLRVPGAPLVLANGSLDDITLAGTCELGGGGGVRAAQVDQGGAGYRSAPDVAFAGPGSGATAQATLAVGVLRITHVGQGYTAAPQIAFSAPEVAGGRPAAAVAAIDAQGALKSINLVDGGSGYLAMPSVTLSGGAGSGAVLEALGRVAGITLLTPGTGYTLPPALTISGGGGRGATARAFSQATTLIYDSNEGNGSFTNSGTLTQNGSLLLFDWAAAANNGAKDRNFHNSGTWLLTRAAISFTSSTGRGMWSGSQCGNSGRLVAADGTQVAFSGMVNTGTIELGAGAVLSSPAYAGGEVRLTNSGQGALRVVGSTAERPAVLGCIAPEGNGPRVLANGAGADKASLEVGGGSDAAVFNVVGGQVLVENGPAARLVIAAGATLGLLTSDNGSPHAFNSRTARLANHGQLDFAGCLRLQGNHAGAVLLDNDGTVTVTGEAVFERLIHSSGPSGFYSAGGTPAVLLVRAGGRLDGAGTLRYRNSSGRPEVGTLSVVVAGTLAVGTATASAATAMLTLVDSALVLGADKAPQTVPQPKDQPQAGLGGATVAIRIRGTGCDQIVVEAGPAPAPVAGEAKRRPEDEPVAVGVTLTPGVDNVLDVRLAAGAAPHGAFTVLRAPRIAGTFTTLRCNGAASTAYTVRYAPTTVEVVFP